MTLPRNDVSEHTRYRRANARLAALEAERDEVMRLRPRTSGKKAAKTRALNELSREIRVARGLLTKARNAIAHGRPQIAAAKESAGRKRSEAAKNGWTTRRARIAAQRILPNLTIPFLTSTGVVDVWPPLKDDRAKVGSYWSAVDNLLSTGSRAALAPFVGEAVDDQISGKRLQFVTDPTIIVFHSDEFDFGASFYRDRRKADVS